jgi:hypothetical protein
VGGGEEVGVSKIFCASRLVFMGFIWSHCSLNFVQCEAVGVRHLSYITECVYDIPGTPLQIPVTLQRRNRV